MKLLGTIEEWMKHDPDAPLTNRKFLQPGAAVMFAKKHDKPVRFTYPIGHRPGDYDDTENLHTRPMIYFGNQCPYIVKGYFDFSALVTFYPSGSGGTYPLSNDMVNDPNWEKYEVDDYYNDPRNK